VVATPTPYNGNTGNESFGRTEQWYRTSFWDESEFLGIRVIRFLNSTATQALMKQMHVKMVPYPYASHDE